MIIHLLLIFITLLGISPTAKGTNNFVPASKEISSANVKLDVPKSTNDVVAVSKFIRDFQRQIVEDVLTVTKGDLNNLGKDLACDPSVGNCSSHRANTTTEKIVNTTEKNVTSLIKCNAVEPRAMLSVELVNATSLTALLTADPNVTSRLTPATCVVLLFYARTCPFSCLAAPHFNALARAFPTIKTAAINALVFESFNTQYGIGGVPTVMLFHNGRPAAKFNESEYTLEMFARFITRYTGVKPVEKMFVTSGDFGGPVPSVVSRETDYMLGLAWLIVLAAIGLLVSRSHSWQVLVELVKSAWHDAHEHTQ